MAPLDLDPLRSTRRPGHEAPGSAPVEVLFVLLLFALLLVASPIHAEERSLLEQIESPLAPAFTLDLSPEVTRQIAGGFQAAGMPPPVSGATLQTAPETSFDPSSPIQAGRSLAEVGEEVVTKIKGGVSDLAVNTFDMYNYNASMLLLGGEKNLGAVPDSLLSGAEKVKAGLATAGIGVGGTALLTLTAAPALAMTPVGVLVTEISSVLTTGATVGLARGGAIVEALGDFVLANQVMSATDVAAGSLVTEAKRSSGSWLPKDEYERRTGRRGRA